jgi:hypothetical protein
MRRCVERLLLVLLIIIEKRSQKITAAAITMPKFRVGCATPLHAIVSADRGLPALPAPRGVVEAVVSTA